VQARVLPVTARHGELAHRLAARSRGAGLRVEVDDRSEPLAARVRDGELAKVPELLVVGDREEAAGSVSVRRRGCPHATLAVDAWLSETTTSARTPSAPGSSSRT
jgi:threonyl-tRNA synthetase